MDVHIWGTVVCPAFSYNQPHTCGVTNLAANHDLITPKNNVFTRQYQRVSISAFNAVYIRSHTNANLIKGQTELFTSLVAQLALLMQRVPRCMNVSWPPLLPASLCSDSVFPPSSLRKLKLHCQLHSLTLCYRHQQPGGEGGRRQLFCLDDSIIPFSGISISIIILIIAFDPKITKQVWNWWQSACQT